MEDFKLTYPLTRILADPVILNVITDNIGVDFWFIAESVYELVETFLKEGYIVTEETLVQLIFEDEKLKIFFVGLIAEGYPEESPEPLVSDEDVQRSLNISAVLMREISKELPENWKDDFALVDMPYLRNNYLLDEEGEFFFGKIHRMSNPSETKTFKVRALEEDKYQVEID